ncbi:MAG: alpha-amylase, partial [Rhodocyclaceae bacterium]|nr:alpha-amylase [Rhodocyclaceae bacterium]
FEGEPARSLAERRKKHSPLRDLAGMLRSFDYAARWSLQRVARGRDKEAALLEPAAEAWRRDSCRAFLHGYAASVAGKGLYGDWAAALRLLDLFVLEKACYELRYELDQRPDQVQVPIHGLLAIVDAH